MFSNLEMRKALRCHYTVSSVDETRTRTNKWIFLHTLNINTVVYFHLLSS